MDPIGVVPAMRGEDFVSQLGMRPLLGVPLALWGVNNLLRRIDAASIVVVSNDERTRAAATRIGVKALESDRDLEPQRIVMADLARPFCSEATITRAMEGGLHELSPFQTSPIERIHIQREEDLELAQAVARGLAPEHPCIAGIRGMRLGLPTARGAIKAIVSDVDGVLTNCMLTLSASGHAARSFNMHDGMAMRLLEAAGYKVGWLSAGGDDGVIRARAKHLGAAAVDVGPGEKGSRFARICAEMGVKPEETLFVGDDVNDLPAMKLAALSACPANAVDEVRACVDVVLLTPGGGGALRELAGYLLDGRVDAV